MTFIDNKLKDKLYRIIFETDTTAGKIFDIILVIAILCNSILIIAESVDSVRQTYETLIMMLGWLFLFIFAIEYILRIFIVKRKSAYILSFFGIVDLMAILPVFFGFIFPEMRFLVVIRVFRLLRMFSILKMGRYMEESSHLLRALKASRAKITVFLATIIFIILIVGSLMYIIEGPAHGFDSIPTSMYWAVVTISTVGYGDISPQTSLGKLVSSLLMIVGYGIIAVPTGIISHELAHASKSKVETKTCRTCHAESSNKEDRFCSKCGTILES